MVVKRIKDIAKVRRGASPRPIDDPKYFGGEVGWVRIADVTISGKYLRKTTQYVSPLGESLSVRVNKGDLIISIAGSVGKSIIVDMPACIHDGFVQIYDLKDTETEFLYYSLKFVEKGLHRFGQSGTQTNLNRDIVGNIQFTWLPKYQQTRIAQILSTADEAIAHTETLIAKYQRIKTGLMQDLLTKGIDEKGNIRSKETHKFVVKNGIEVPEEWEVDTLGVLKPYITSGSRNWAAYYSIEGAVFIRIGNLTREHINLRLDDVQRVDIKNSSEGKRTQLMKDDIIVSITADLGIIGVIPDKFEEAYINQHIALVRFCDKNINPRFIGFFLASHHGSQQFDLLNDSGAKAGLSLRTLIKLKIVIPRYSEQCLSVSKIDSIDEHIKIEKRRLKKLHSLKTGLMQDLLSGKVRVNMNN